MAAVLVRAEVSVIQVLGEMDMAKCVTAAKSELGVMPRKPAQSLSPLALAVLAMLTEAPMHPYRMQQLINARGKDEVINVGQRNSLYQTIDRLLRGDLIAIRETERDGAFPERTLYP